MKNEILNTLKTAIVEAQNGLKTKKELYNNNSITGKNEFLFFIKPEITIQSDKINLDAILTLILNKIDKYGMGIRNIQVIPAHYLKEHNIIAQHYGVINSIARNAIKNLSPEAKEKFNTQFQIGIEKVKVYGGIEFLESYPSFTPISVDYIWQNSPTIKLGGGAYCQSLKLDGQPVYLVNGFHPRQLEHFIAPGRSIVTFTLTGDTDWKTARNNFIGKTNPADAIDGSIRRELFINKELYGLSAVNSSWNGVHLSAGPVEALVELIRYNSDFDSGKIVSITDYNLGRELIANFGQDNIQKILSNETIIIKGKPTTIFDLTEEMDSLEAITILMEVYMN
jgi:hypothetical protein